MMSSSPPASSLLLPRPPTPSGGALAHLAAFDVQHHLSLAPDQVGVRRVRVHARACMCVCDVPGAWAMHVGASVMCLK